MEQIFNILTIAVISTGVVLLIITAIHCSVKLVRMTIGRKSGLHKKDTDQSNVAEKDSASEKRLEKKEDSPALNKLCTIYKEKYLTHKPLEKRGQVYIEQENINLIKQILFVLAPKASVSGYINNVVNEHLEKCKPEIVKLYKEKRAGNGN